MREDVVLTVVIPTRNRAAYLRHSVAACLDALKSDCELVVVDNSDEWTEMDYGTPNATALLSVIRTPGQLDANSNFERGLAAAKGEYVCFIGDDDAVLPDIVAAARWCRDHEVEAMFQSCGCSYVWPDVQFKRLGARTRTGELRVTVPNADLLPVELERLVERVLRNAGTDLMIMPRAYHGLVRTTALRRLRYHTGREFPGPSPDMGSAMALALTLERVFAVDLPLVLSGKAGKSAGGLGAAKCHEGKLEDISWIPREAIAGWSSVVPHFFSGATIWAEGVVCAARTLGGTDLVARFNVARLLAQCIVFYPRSISMTWRHTLAWTSNLRSVGEKLAFWLTLSAEVVWAWFERTRSLMIRLELKWFGRSEVRFVGLSNVHEAAREYACYQRKRGFGWPQLEMVLRRETSRLHEAARTSGDR